MRKIMNIQDLTTFLDDTLMESTVSLNVRVPDPTGKTDYIQYAITDVEYNEETEEVIFKA